MLSLSPSGVDSEIRGLGLDCLEDDEDMLLVFMDYLIARLKSSKNLELSEVLLKILMEAHGADLIKDKVRSEKLEILQDAHKSRWLHMEELLQSNLCLIKFMSTLA